MGKRKKDPLKSMSAHEKAFHFGMYAIHYHLDLSANNADSALDQLSSVCVRPWIEDAATVEHLKAETAKITEQ